MHKLIKRKHVVLKIYRPKIDLQTLYLKELRFYITLKIIVKGWFRNNNAYMEGNLREFQMA